MCFSIKFIFFFLNIISWLKYMYILVFILDGCKSQDKFNNKFGISAKTHDIIKAVIHCKYSHIYVTVKELKPHLWINCGINGITEWCAATIHTVSWYIYSGIIPPHPNCNTAWNIWENVPANISTLMSQLRHWLQKHSQMSNPHIPDGQTSPFSFIMKILSSAQVNMKV